eukprot:14489049-Alexandrium_andersonii.AAC.1
MIIVLSMRAWVSTTTKHTNLNTQPTWSMYSTHHVQHSGTCASLGSCQASVHSMLVSQRMQGHSQRNRDAIRGNEPSTRTTFGAPT